MGWLNEIEHTYIYKCEFGHVNYSMERHEVIGCPDCADITAESPEDTYRDSLYQGFVPVQMGITTKISYEQNGRLATKTILPDGTVKCISKTKENYLKTGKNESQLSREYTRHLQDKQQEDFGRFRSKTLETTATVSAAGKHSLKEI